MILLTCLASSYQTVAKTDMPDINFQNNNHNSCFKQSVEGFLNKVLELYPYKCMIENTTKIRIKYLIYNCRKESFQEVTFRLTSKCFNGKKTLTINTTNECFLSQNKTLHRPINNFVFFNQSMVTLPERQRVVFVNKNISK
jgi:hypothetical protein